MVAPWPDHIDPRNYRAFVDMMDAENLAGAQALTMLSKTWLLQRGAQFLAGWSAAGDALFVFDPARSPPTVERHEVGTEQVTDQFVIPVPPTTISIDDVHVAADGTTYAVGVVTRSATLYRVVGVQR